MRHVLVAVFELPIMTMLSEVLEIEGYHVTRAHDQDQLIAVLRSVLHPLVVLLDVWAIEGGPGSATSSWPRLWRNTTSGSGMLTSSPVEERTF